MNTKIESFQIKNVYVDSALLEILIKGDVYPETEILSIKGFSLILKNWELKIQEIIEKYPETNSTISEGFKGEIIKSLQKHALIRTDFRTGFNFAFLILIYGVTHVLGSMISKSLQNETMNSQVYIIAFSYLFSYVLLPLLAAFSLLKLYYQVKKQYTPSYLKKINLITFIIVIITLFSLIHVLFIGKTFGC